MENILEYFSVQKIFFTVLGYPMSYIEFFGTILNILAVWLVSIRNMWTWLTGILAVSIFMLLFYQIRLYADFFEQIYYLAANIYGWFLWSRSKPTKDKPVKVGFSSPRFMIAVAVACLIGTAVWAYAMLHLDLWFPTLFPDPASYPWLDSFTTVLSFAAMLLMIAKRTESWIYWIIVDVIAVWLYFVKDVKFVSLLYASFLCLAFYGLYKWWKSHGNSEVETDLPVQHAS